jgi:hypothetical protein
VSEFEKILDRVATVLFRVAVITTVGLAILNAFGGGR